MILLSTSFESQIMILNYEDFYYESSTVKWKILKTDKLVLIEKMINECKLNLVNLQETR